MTEPLNPTTVRDELRTHLADVLYVEPGEVADDASFTDLGLDSVLGVELIALINGRYGLAEMVEVVYEHDTLAKLADHVCARAALPEALRS
jgi:acyl carrier protein